MRSQAFGGQLKKFRNRLEIPVGVGDIDMAQVSGELRQFAPDIKAGAIPFDQLPRRETVTKILKPWPTADAPASSCRS